MAFPMDRTEDIERNNAEKYLPGKCPHYLAGKDPLECPTNGSDAICAYTGKAEVCRKWSSMSSATSLFPSAGLGREPKKISISS